MRFDYNKKELTGGFNGKSKDLVKYIESILMKKIDTTLLVVEYIEKELEKELENYIYSNYPNKKQQQDEKWVSNYSAKLKALNVENLESKIVSKVKAFFDGKTLEETISDVPEEQKKYFEKLVKVGVRAEWLELSIEEGKKAIEEKRDFSFRDFPIFDLN